MLLTACGAVENPVRVGAVAPDFALSGYDAAKPVKLSALRGQPVMLNFWATWCSNCKAEMPLIAQTYQKHKAEGLTVLGINSHDDAGGAKEYLNGKNFSYPMLSDLSSQAKNSYRISGYPTSIFIDRQGIIKVIHIGEMDATTLEASLVQILLH